MSAEEWKAGNERTASKARVRRRNAGRHEGAADEGIDSPSTTLAPRARLR
jgi:hypothetical protein